MMSALATVVVLSAWPLLAGHAPQPAPADAVDITITPARPAVGVNEPVVLEFAIRNRLDEQVEFDLGGNYVGNIRIRLTGPAGESRQLPRLTRNGIHELGIVALPAGQVFSHQIVLDEWVTLEQGSYRAEITVHSLFLTRSGAVFQPPPPRVASFEVGPRHEARLHQLCEDLAGIIVSTERGSELSEHWKSVRVLARMADSVAVPCIEKVLRATHESDFLLIPALARINDVEARVLLRWLSTSDDEVRARRAQGMINALAAGRLPVD